MRTGRAPRMVRGTVILKLQSHWPWQKRSAAGWNRSGCGCIRQNPGSLLLDVRRFRGLPNQCSRGGRAFGS
jgi:hypothetical protein